VLITDTGAAVALLQRKRLKTSGHGPRAEIGIDCAGRLERGERRG
jgi:hypothetical protein